MQPDQNSTDFRRDRNGRPLIVPIGGGAPTAYMRASGYCAPLESTGNLTKWTMARVVEGAQKMPDLITRITDIHDDTIDLASIADTLFKAGGGTAAADLGNEIHFHIEQLDKGLISIDEIPEDLRHHAVNWLELLDRHGLEVVSGLVECKLVCDKYMVAGSADNILRRRCDGALLVADKKTGRSIPSRPLKFAGQIGLYSQSVLYDVETGERTPIDINRETGYLFHLPAAGGKPAVYEVDLQAADEVIETARNIYILQRSFPTVSPLVAAPPKTVSPDAATPARRAWIKECVATVVNHSPEAQRRLLSIWPKDVPPFKGGHQHTDAEINLIIDAVTKVETEYDMPFGPSDPDRERIEENAIEIIKKAFPGAHAVDDSGEVEPEELDRLRDILDALPEDARTFIAKMTKEANAANRSLSLSRVPSPRRYQIAQALVWVAMFSHEDVARALVALVEPEALTDSTLGRIFGGLRTEQAVRLQQIAQALDNGLLTLAFNDAGLPEIHGDVQSLAA
jgi:hypothetical protein